MADDIVTRLRMSADLMQGFPQMKAQHFNAEWVIEAADEIERLRKAGNDIIDALTEMAEKQMLPKVTVRLLEVSKNWFEAINNV